MEEKYNINNVEVPAGESVTVMATVNLSPSYQNNSFVLANNMTL